MLATLPAISAPNTSAATALPLQFGQTVTAEMGFGGPNELWYYVDVPSNGRLTLNSTTSGLHLRTTLFESDGTTAIRWGSPVWQNQQLYNYTRDGLHAGRYFIRVAASGNGSFSLTVNFEAAIPNITTADSWARDGILAAGRKGIIPQSLLSVDINLTSVINRQDFCRMAIRWVEYATGRGIETVLSERGLTRNQNAFTDTSDPDILAAYALGITSGIGNNRFNPFGAFTREQAAVMIMNACRAIGISLTVPRTAAFADASRASAWAHPGINFARHHNIMQGTGNNNFSPRTQFTMQEAIVTFNNIRHGDLPR